MRMQELVNNLIERHRPATLVVTHDVDEAIVLADRVAVLRDGKLSLDLTIDLDDRQIRSGAQFEALRERFLAELGVLPSPHHLPPPSAQDAIVSATRSEDPSTQRVLTPQ